MRTAKHLVLCACACLVLGGCGAAAKPLAGSPHLLTDPGFRGRPSSFRATRVACLRAEHFRITLFIAANHTSALRVGASRNGPVMLFEPTPGYAEGLKITGNAQGAELIGPVLLYPNDADLQTMKLIEGCAAIGVS